MIHWKQALTQMRQILRSSFLYILCISLLLSLSACNKTINQTITLGQWIDTMITQMNIQASSTIKPYYINVDASYPYFTSVQTAVEWGILTNEEAFDGEEELTKEWCAYTLARLLELEEVNPSFNDSTKSHFSSYIQATINFGLFTLDKRDCFNPKQVMEKQDALTLLDKSIAYYDTKPLEEVSDFELNTDVKEVYPIEFDQDSETIIVDSATQLQESDVIQFQDDTYQTQTYQVEKVNEQPAINSNNEILDEYYEVELAPIEYFDVVEQGSFTYDEPLDFNDAIIEFESSVDNDLLLQQLSSTTTHQKTFDGFRVNLTTSGTNITVTVTKEIKDKINVIGTFKLYNLKPIIIWKTSVGNIDHAKFELRASSVQTLQVKVGESKTLYADLKDINRDNFISKLTSNYKERSQLEDVYIPIATISVPIPQIPTVTIKLQVHIRISANGRVELKLVNDHDIGFERKNGLNRIIKANTHDADFSLKADAYALAGFKAGLTALNTELMDIGVDGGIKASADTTVHLYDDNSNHTKQVVNVDGDLADRLSTITDDVLTCVDLSGYWTLIATLNSSKTLLSKLGAHYQLELLNKNNAPLIPGLTMHLENGIVVDKCTRGVKQIHKNDSDKIQNYQKITLSKYSYVLDKSDTYQLEILGIPNDISMQDLLYSSSDESVVTVSNKGLLTGLKEGAAQIKIYDKDNKYTTTLNVVVRMVV